MGQRKPVAFIDPRRQNKVPRTFWGRARQDGRFDLDEVFLVFEEPANGLDNVVAQAHVSGHAIASQIQVPILQPQVFSHIFFFCRRDLEGHLLAHGVENGERIGIDLDLTRGQFVVEGFGWALGHPTDHFHHIFIAGFFGDGVGVRGALWVTHDLDRAGAIAQIQKYNTAMVSASIYPAIERDRFSNVLGSELSAIKATHGDRRVKNTKNKTFSL